MEASHESSSSSLQEDQHIKMQDQVFSSCATCRISRLDYFSILDRCNRMTRRMNSKYDFHSCVCIQYYALLKVLILHDHKTCLKYHEAQLCH